MTNIILTDYCNRNCSYCFASETMAAGRGVDTPWKDLVAAVDMVVAGGRQAIGVLGGEPSLSRHFRDFLRYLILRGVQPKVFTNGIWNRPLLAEVEQIVEGTSTIFIVNVNHPDVETASNAARQREFLTRFNRQCGLSFNVFRSDLDPCFLVELARECGLRHSSIRVGLAEPIAGADNDFLSLQDYERIGPMIVVLAEQAFELDVRVRFDCGFPMCMFTDEQLGRLTRVGSSAKFYCQPAVDIGRELESWACYPLEAVSRVQASVDMTARELHEELSSLHRLLRDENGLGLFAACDDCAYRHRGVCGGGCISHQLPREGVPLPSKRKQHVHPRVPPPQVESCCGEGCEQVAACNCA